jgi:DNA-binding transcriptional ArsR family regulator
MTAVTPNVTKRHCYFAARQVIITINKVIRLCVYKTNLMIPSRELLKLKSSLFATLADPTRLEILLLLAEGEAPVSAMAERLQRPQPTISRHLKILRENGLVASERLGSNQYYRLLNPALLEMIHLANAVLQARIEAGQKLLQTMSSEENAT